MSPSNNDYWVVVFDRLQLLIWKISVFEKLQFSLRGK